MLTLNAKIRDPKINLDFIRKNGELPAVFYGAGVENNAIVISKSEFKKIWNKAGESTTVKIKTADSLVDVLIHEVQTNPVTDEPIHVDFLVVDMNKKIKVEIPLEFTGISEVVKSGLGNLVKVLHQVEVEALPKDLPHEINVDISKLVNLDSLIFVSDLILPKGVEIVNKENEVIASVITQQEEKEEEVQVDLSAIEVEKKGKKDLPEQTGEEAEKSNTAE